MGFTREVSQMSIPVVKWSTPVYIWAGNSPAAGTVRSIRNRLDGMQMIPRFTGALALVLFAHPSAAQQSCDDWNTATFFVNATSEDVAACLEAGADVHARTDYVSTVLGRGGGTTPLHFAARYCRDDPGTVTLLLAAGADVHARNWQGLTPLHVAAERCKDPSVVTELVEAGAEINAQADSGDTPLHSSWSNQNPLIAYRLLELGADRTVRNVRGQVADPVSCDRWNTEVFARTATLEDWTACLGEGADVNARDDDGNTPLLFATLFEAGGTVGTPVSEGPEVVALLLGAGAEVNARNTLGATPLFNAVGGRQVAMPAGPLRSEVPSIVSLLLEAGADVNARLDDGEDSDLILRFWPETTPLHRAAALGARETVVLLLEAGADVHARDRAGNTPLLRAGFGNPEVFEALLEAGADVRDRNKRGEGVVLNAIISEELPGQQVTDIVRRLLALGADVGEESSVFGPPLYEAARLPEVPGLIAVLLAAGADANYRTPSGRSPLHAAADDGSPSTIAALVAGGAEVDEQDGSGRTPLHLAIEAKQPANVTALLEAGADARLRVPQGETPLHLAAVWPPTPFRHRDNPPEPDTLMVIALVAAGADVNARNRYGETPLHAATRNRHAPVADKLLALGAEPLAEDDLGRIPRPMVCDWMRTYFFRQVPWEGVLGCLQAGADVHARDEDLETPLHRLAGAEVLPDDYPAAKVVAALVEAGADLDARDYWGRAPLHAAMSISRDRTVVAAALLEAGADVNAQDARGRTPLHGAVEKLASIGLLVGAGADVHATDSEGRTPLHVALQHDKPAGVAALLELGADTGARDDSGNVADPVACTRWNTGSFFRVASIGVVAACIEEGASVTARSEEDGNLAAGSTPLHFAAAWAPDHEVVGLLVRAGADVNARDEDHYTPLHRAAETNVNAAVATALIEAGADVEAWTDDFITYHYSWHGTPLHAAASSNENPAVTAALLEAGANVHAQSEDVVGTPLHKAARWNRSPEVARLLVEAGADVNAWGMTYVSCCWLRYRQTPLHLAARANPAVFLLLLDAGADPTAVDQADKTPMDYAREDEALQELEVVKRSGR